MREFDIVCVVSENSTDFNVNIRFYCITVKTFNCDE